MGLRFDPEFPFEKTAFRGVRALFLDLHLITGVKTTDEKQHFANIASILETNISEIGGPFIVILWTEHAHLAQKLIDYLDGSLDAARPWCRPLAIIPLAKERFINVTSGWTEAADDLRAAVQEALAANPQLSALISWETDVLAAAGETLASLISLVPGDEQTNQRFAGALDGVLSRLAVEAVGKKHVADNPRIAVSSALAPILADRIVNQDVTTATAAIWTQAVTRHGEKQLPQATPVEAGGINRMLHVAVVGSENIRSSDWGAVSEIPANLWTDAALNDMLGVSIDDLLREEFKINRADHAQCRPRLIRIGAACDHAQKRPGPIPFLFGIEIPRSVARIKINGQLRVFIGRVGVSYIDPARFGRCICPACQQSVRDHPPRTRDERLDGSVPPTRTTAYATHRPHRHLCWSAWYRPALRPFAVMSSIGKRILLSPSNQTGRVSSADTKDPIHRFLNADVGQRHLRRSNRQEFGRLCKSIGMIARARS